MVVLETLWEITLSKEIVTGVLDPDLSIYAVMVNAPELYKLVIAVCVMDGVTLNEAAATLSALAAKTVNVGLR